MKKWREVKGRVDRISEKKSEVKWWEVLSGSEGIRYYEMVVFLFNPVIYISLLLCLCILIVRLCIFIVMYVLYSVSLCCFVYCLCVSVYLQLPPGLNPIAVNKMYQILKLFGGLYEKWNTLE